MIDDDILVLMYDTLLYADYYYTNFNHYFRDKIDLVFSFLLDVRSLSATKIL